MGKTGQRAAATPKQPPSPKPWKRKEGEPFKPASRFDPKKFSFATRHTLPGYQDRKSLTTWSHIHSIFYNGMLNVAIEPTRTLDMEILCEMGIDGSVRKFIKDMGLGKLAYADFDLYPDLVRQFLATCEVQDVDDRYQRRLYFFCNGIHHSVRVGDLARFFGWAPIRWDKQYDSHTLEMMEHFWKAIAYGNYDTIELKIAKIANPTLRIVAKALAHTYFCRQEPDRIHKSALAFMFTGLGSDLQEMLTFGTPATLDWIDLSLLFANMLAERKYRALGDPPGPRIDYIGSLITPILKLAGVDMRNATVDTRRSLMDRAYLAHTRIFRRGIYRWTTASGAAHYCTLPRPDWTHVDTLDQLRFAVPGEEQCTATGGTLPAFQSAPMPIRTDHDDSAIRRCPHGNLFPAAIPLTSDFPDDYYRMIPSLPAGASEGDWRAHRDEMQRQQTSILREIVGALTHVTWTPPAPCCPLPTEQDDEHQR